LAAQQLVRSALKEAFAEGLMNILQRGCLTVAVAAISSLSTLTSSAETLAEWATFQTAGDQATQPASNTAVGVVGYDMTRNGGLAPNVGADSFNSSGWATNAPGNATVVNAGAYVELGISIQSGYVADLDSLLMGSRSSGSGPASIGVFTSIDHYATPIATIDQSATTGFGGTQGTGFANTDVDLSALTNVTGDFYVRFANVGGAATATPTRAGEMDVESTWRIGDFFAPGDGFTVLQITGNVALVPEPASLAPAILAGLFILRKRWRASMGGRL
jgi:hypothetical protein